MRNENEKSLVLRQIPCFFIFKYALFIFYYFSYKSIYFIVIKIANMLVF